ncbi:MAG TPA: VanW family protein [Nocardioidaceae bacterium]|nr:VanW family protein [Nocardioidaceae bacterium]
MTDLPFKEKATDSRVIALLLVGLLVLFGGLYVAGYLFTGDRVPRGTTVAGIDIGGLRPAAAQTTLEDELSPRLEEPIVVAADGRRATIRPADAGLAVDYAASVEQAGGGRSWSPGRMWDYFTGGDDLAPVVDVDETALDKAIAKFAKKVDDKPVEGRITFDAGTAEMKLPEAGQQLDREAASDAVVDAFLGESTESAVQLEVTEVPAEVSEEEVRTAMDDFANPAMSAPVTLVLGDERVMVRPEAYSRALSLKAEDGKLEPKVDVKLLMAAIRPAMKTVALSPRPATVQLVGGEPTVVPGRNGVTFDPAEVASAFPELVVRRDGKRELSVETKVDRPSFTTKDAEKLQIEEVVSSFTTYFPHADYRNTNLGRAAELVTGTVLKPGETFSLNDTVGERTAANGFTKGFMISNGVYKEDFGGGVSQVATTLFNGMFFAGLEDVEHKPHSFYIDRYPIGREATVAWGSVDLKFKNTTPYGVLIEAWINPSSSSSSGEMNVRFWSTKHWDITTGVSDRYNFTEEETRYIQGEDCVPNEGYGGFDIDVFRYFRKPGSNELVDKETFHTTYTPSDTVVCGPPPKNGSGN